MLAHALRAPHSSAPQPRHPGSRSHHAAVARTPRARAQGRHTAPDCCALDASAAPRKDTTECSTAAERAQDPLDRRCVLLQGSTATALSVLASALQAAQPEAAHALRTVELPNGQLAAVYEHGMSLAIVALRGSVPQQWILDFKSALGKYAGFTLGQRHQLEDIYKDLQDPTSKNSAGAADVATLGDAWLAQAIRDKLVQPISNAESYRWWKYLSPRWQRLVKRNAEGQADAAGQVYGAPYRWGASLIAYRKERLIRRGGHAVLDWPDLLQPQLQGRLALTDSSRELLGFALKTLGLGYNASMAQLAAAGITEEVLAQQLRLIRQQVKLFSSNDHVRALQAGDVWAVVGWSQDLITLAERSNSIEALVPKSGTSLFADIWVVPAGAQGGNLQTGPSPLLPAWLEFGLMPSRVPGHPGLKSGAAPLLLPEPQIHPDCSKVGEDRARAEAASTDPLSAAGSMSDPQAAETEAGLLLQHAQGYMPKDRDVLRRSEFMLSLEPAVVQMYRQALQQAGV